MKYATKYFLLRVIKVAFPDAYKLKATNFLVMQQRFFKKGSFINHYLMHAGEKPHI